MDNEAKAAQRVNTIFLLVDIIEQASMETEALLKTQGLYRYEVKQNIEMIKHGSKRLIRFADKWDSEHADVFGDMADELKEVIYKFLGVI